MSKSLGNLYTLDEVLARGFSAEELRYVLLSASYRQQLNFTWESLAAARKALARLRDLQTRLGGPLEINHPTAESFGTFAPVLEALLNDLNTPEALGRLFVIAKNISQTLDSENLSPTQRQADKRGLALVLMAFGFTLPAPKIDEAPAAVQALAAERWLAKQNRDWATADALRQQLTNSGWTTKDAADSYQLFPL